MKLLPLLCCAVFCGGCLLAEPLSDQVLERYEQILAEHPETGTAFDRVYQHYLEIGELDALESRWKAAMEKPDDGRKPGRADWRLLLGLLQERRGKEAEANKTFLLATEEGGGWRAWAALANAEARAGKLEKAADAYKKAIDQKPDAKSLGGLYRGLALCQERLMKSGDAAATWKAYVDAVPGDPFVLEEAGGALLEAGQFAAAREVFERLRDSDAADPSRKLRGELRLATVEQEEGRRDEALKLYDAALESAGSTSWLQKEIREKIERLFRSGDDLPALVKYYEARLVKHPDDVEAALRLSEAMTELSRDDDALAVLKQAAEKAPDRRDIQKRYAQAMLQADRAAEAEELLDRLARRYVEDSALLELLGEAQWMRFQAKEIDQSVAVNTWKRLAPEGADAGAVQRLAEILRQHELTDETLEQYRRMMELDPESADRRQRFVEYLMEIERRQEAFEVLDGLVAGERASGENYLRLAKLLRRYNENEAALGALETASRFPERAFDRLLLAWQIQAGAGDWDAAGKSADGLWAVAYGDAEIDRADECLVQARREQGATNSVIGDMLALQKANPDRFSERQFRLLFLLAIDANDTGTAEFALREGLRRFPQSTVLSKLELSYARRAADTERMISVLRRLGELEPLRAADWKLELARVYRDNSQKDEAVELAREAALASPANADFQVALADILFFAGKRDEAMEALQTAVRLSDSPNRVRLRLAEAYEGAGKPDQALRVLDEAFDAEETPQAKVALMARLTQAYLGRGRIEELIARFRSRQQSEEGGWRYALYLTEIYIALGDRGRAMEELDKALAGKPDDVQLLRRLFQLSQESGSTAASLRYARKLAEADPSPANRASLGNALADEGQSEEALALIRANADEFLSDPAAWQQTIAMLQAEQKTDELTALLERHLKGRPDDLDTRLVLGELLMGSDNPSLAEPILWDVFQRKEDPLAEQAPVPQPSAGRNTAARHARLSPFFAGIQKRSMRVNAAYQRAGAAFSPRLNQSRRSMYRIQGMLSATNAAPGEITAARDDAMILLAAVAIHEGREREFLDRIAMEMKDVSADERIAVYCLLQAMDPLAAELEAFLETDQKPSEAVKYACSTLQNYSTNRMARNLDVDPRLMAVVNKLNERDPSGRDIQTRYHFLLRMGNEKEAEKVAREFYRDLDESDLASLQIALFLAIQQQDLARADKYLGKIRAISPEASTYSHMELAFAQAALATEDYREKGVKIFVDLLKKNGEPGKGLVMPFVSSWSTRSTAATWVSFQSQPLGSSLQFPMASLDIPEADLRLVRSLANNVRSQEGVKAIVKALRKGGDGDSRIRLISIYLLWNAGEKEEAAKAMGEFVKKHPEDVLWVNYAAMLDSLGKTDEALAALAEIKTRSGDVPDLAARIRFGWLMRESQKQFPTDEKDIEAFREAARAVLRLRLQEVEKQQIVEPLKKIGMNEEAEKLEKRSKPGSTRQGRSRELVEVLREQMNAKDNAGAESVALAILSADPFSRRQNTDYYRREALEALKRMERLDAYIGELATRKDGGGGEARLAALQAEAMATKDPKLAEPYYRRLMELRPRDVKSQILLAKVLVRGGQTKEAVRIYDGILATKPEEVFVDGTNFMEAYRKEDAMEPLAKALESAPVPGRDAFGMGQQNYGYVFLQLAREIEKSQPSRDMTDLWLRAIDWDGTNQQSLPIRVRLMRKFVKDGDKEKAMGILNGVFGSDAENQASVMMMNRMYQTPNPFSMITTHGSGEVEIAAFSLLKAAAEEGLIDEFMKSIESLPQNKSSDPSLKLLVQLAAKDPAALVEIREWLDQTKSKEVGVGFILGRHYGNYNPVIWRVVANEIRDWPKGRALAGEMNNRLMDTMEERGDYYGILPMTLQQVTMAREDGKPEEMRKAIKRWLRSVGEMRIKNPGMALDSQASLLLLQALSAAGLVSEAQEVASVLRTDPNIARSKDTLRRISEEENSAKISAGGEGMVMGVAVAMPGEKDGEVLWEIRPGSSDPNDQAMFMLGEVSPKLNGRYDLEVLFGENKNLMKRLFAKKAVPGRGVWKGSLPSSRGFIQAIVRRGDETVAGPQVPVLIGDRIVSPDWVTALAKAKDGIAEGWQKLPETTIVLKKGGPMGGNYVHLAGERNWDTQMASARIKLEPGKRYCIAGWLRCDSQGSIRVACQLYDEKGKKIDSERSVASGRQNQPWVYFSREISDRPAASELEVTLVFRGMADIQGLQIFEVEPD